MMVRMNGWKRKTIGLVLGVLLCLQLGAEKSTDISAVLSVMPLHPGDKAMVAVIVDVNPGLHAQSNKPLDDSLIPMIVKMNANPVVSSGDVIYPPPQLKTYPELGQVSIYTGHTVILVPVTVSATAPLGATTISGSVSYQACNDTACFVPEKQKFEVDTEIVAASVAATANQPELFKAATPPPTAPPAVAASAPPPRILGHDLTQNAYPLAFSAAFLVGIIFNLMPCVLPVLPLKIMGFYEAASTESPAEYRAGSSF